MCPQGVKFIAVRFFESLYRNKNYVGSVSLMTGIYQKRIRQLVLLFAVLLSFIFPMFSSSKLFLLSTVYMILLNTINSYFSSLLPFNCSYARTSFNLISHAVLLIWTLDTQLEHVQFTTSNHREFSAKEFSNLRKMHIFVRINSMKGGWHNMFRGWVRK